jgi:hypothetical protein
MMTNYPITPPPAILQQLRSKAPTSGWFRDAWIAEQAAQWGSDQELEACCEWLDQKVLLQHQSDVIPELRAARRPKPPSLKAQALETLEDDDIDVYLIRRALEALPE